MVSILQTPKPTQDKRTWHLHKDAPPNDSEDAAFLLIIHEKRFCTFGTEEKDEISTLKISRDKNLLNFGDPLD